MSTTTHALRTARTTFARRLSDRRDLRRLRDELAGYDTPAARDDLHAMLARHSDEESAPIRQILSGWPAPQVRRFG